MQLASLAMLNETFSVIFKHCAVVLLFANFQPILSSLIVYNNSLVNSSYAWRPLRLWFVKETTERIIEEKTRLDKERSELQTYEFWDGIHVKFAGYCSMCDMKVLFGFMKHRGNQTCPFCGATYSQVSTSSQCLKIILKSLMVFDQVWGKQF